MKGRTSADLGLAAFKTKTLIPALKEYFVSGDSTEVARCLQELNQAGFHSLIVNQVSLQKPPGAHHHSQHLFAAMKGASF